MTPEQIAQWRLAAMQYAKSKTNDATQQQILADEHFALAVYFNLKKKCISLCEQMVKHTEENLMYEQSAFDKGGNASAKCLLKNINALSP